MQHSMKSNMSLDIIRQPRVTIEESKHERKLEELTVLKKRTQAAKIRWGGP